MPIYEYTCKDCGKEFEELVFSRDECPPCPSCGSEQTAKLISRCSHKSVGVMSGAPAAGGSGQDSSPSFSNAGSACAGCSGGNCASCK